MYVTFKKLVLFFVDGADVDFSYMQDNGLIEFDGDCYKLTALGKEYL